MHFFKQKLLVAALGCSTAMAALTAPAQANDFTLIDLDGIFIPVVTNDTTQPFVPIDPSLYPDKQVIQLYPEFENPDNDANKRTTGDVAKLQAAQLLGNGYDDITGEVLANDCWITPNKLDIIDTEALVNELPLKEVEVITSYDSLTTFFKKDRKASLKLTVNGSTFIDVTNADKKVVENTTRVHEYGVVAFKMRHKHKRYTAKSQDQLTMNPRNVLELETQSQPSGKKEFRSMCGDKYLSSVTSGRELMGTVRLHSHEDNTDSQKDANIKFNLGIKSLFTLASYSDITDNDFVQKHKDVEFQLVYSKIGGRPLSALKDLKITVRDEVTGEEKQVPALSGNVDTVQELAALIVAFNEDFKDDVTLGLVDSQEQYYPMTEELLAQNKSHFDVFLDYNPTARKLASWHLLDGFVEQRCAIYSPDKGAEAADLAHVGLDANYYISAAPKKMFDGVEVSQNDLCIKIRDTITDYKNRCSDHNIWADPNMTASEQCYYPKQPECVVISGYQPIQCMQRANQLDVWEITKGGFTVSNDNSSQPFEIGIGSGLSAKSKEGEGKFCYDDEHILIDVRKKWVNISQTKIPKEAGVTVNVLEAHNFDQAYSVANHPDNAPACMTHTAKITRPGFFTSAARYKAEVILHGFKPISGRGYPL